MSKLKKKIYAIPYPSLSYATFYRLAKLIRQRGRELKREVDEAVEEVIKKLNDQLGVLSPSASATLQFIPSEFSLGLAHVGHISGPTEGSSSSFRATAVIRDQGGITVSTTAGEVI